VTLEEHRLDEQTAHRRHLLQCPVRRQMNQPPSAGKYLETSESISTTVQVVRPLLEPRANQ
jgi:hypothetical protein